MGALEASGGQEAGLPASRARSHGGSGDSGGHGGAERLGGHGGSGESGSHGGSGDSVALALGLATQAMAICPPQKNISWGSSPLGAVQEKQALWGTLDARTLGGAREATAAVDSCRDSHKGP